MTRSRASSAPYWRSIAIGSLLMRDEQIVGYFDTPRDALRAATELFPDGIFSIQEVTDEPIDLGFWSHDFEMRRDGSCPLTFGM